MNPVLIIFASAYFFILPLLTGLVRWRAHSRVQRWLTILVIAMGALQVLQKLANKFYDYNIPLFHLSPPLEICFMAPIIMLGLKNLKMHKSIPWFAGAFTFYCILSVFWIQGLSELPTIAKTVESFAVSVLSLLFFFVLLRDLHIDRIGNSALFWFFSGALLYYSGSSVIFFLSTWILHDPESVMKLWTIHAILLILLYCFYTIALLCKENPISSSKVS